MWKNITLILVFFAILIYTKENSQKEEVLDFGTIISIDNQIISKYKTVQIGEKLFPEHNIKIQDSNQNIFFISKNSNLEFLSYNIIKIFEGKFRFYIKNKTFQLKLLNKSIILNKGDFVLEEKENRFTLTSLSGDCAVNYQGKNLQVNKYHQLLIDKSKISIENLNYDQIREIKNNTVTKIKNNDRKIASISTKKNVLDNLIPFENSPDGFNKLNQMSKMCNLKVHFYQNEQVVFSRDVFNIKNNFIFIKKDNQISKLLYLGDQQFKIIPFKENFKDHKIDDVDFNGDIFVEKSSCLN